MGDRTAPLAGLVKLTNLHIAWTGTKDISALAGLTALEDLWLHGDRITDLAPLLSHTRLRILKLEGNPLGPAAVDTQIPKIRANNPGIELSFDTRER